MNEVKNYNWIMVESTYLKVLASGFTGTVREAEDWAEELWNCDLRYDYMFDSEFEEWALMYEVDSDIDEYTSKINGKYYRPLDI